MKRVYQQIACYMKDIGRCKYASLRQTDARRPLTRTCMCEKIDEEASKERELLEYLMDEMRYHTPIPHIERNREDDQNPKSPQRHISISDTLIRRVPPPSNSQNERKGGAHLPSQYA